VIIAGEEWGDVIDKIQVTFKPDGTCDLALSCIDIVASGELADWMAGQEVKTVIDAKGDAGLAKIIIWKAGGEGDPELDPNVKKYILSMP